MKEIPKDKPAKWSFIETSRSVLEKQKLTNSSESVESSDKTKIPLTPDNISEADPEVKEFLSDLSKSSLR
ncbi:hypothetical protein [Legionella brunensis]|uniref:Uncharacterized protein n=1 Tax=Legionella brunensis TaxID=29422 RepID=A0A0W0SMI3_9GAMM|nr:hypothetical protein [Legionella brunensis]KTC84165.1 hypothetical protein Lbru_1526 [Legionella brunensis]